jgi:predicted Na+-dependent transporter
LLTVRDVPFWLALVGLVVMALSGVAEASADPGLAPTVALVLGGCLLALVVGRGLVRRIAYRRAWRVSLAILVVLVLFPLLGALAFLLLPAAIALLAIELFVPAPIPAGRSPSADTPGAAGLADFDWPDDGRG